MKVEPNQTKRKSLDERLGIIGIASIAVVGMFLFQPIANVCGLTAIYLLIKRRNDTTISKRTKIIGWVLVATWALLVVAVLNYQTL